MSARNSAERMPRTGVNAEAEPRSTSASLPSFLAIYHQHFDFVWSSAKYLGVDTEVIDDIVQEVFMVVHARMHTLQHTDALRSWIYGVVRRTVSTHRRSNRSRTDLRANVAQLAEYWGTHPVTPLDLLERNAKLDLLASLLSELDDIKREVFVAAELEEMTVPEIAKAFEIPVNTAYSRLRTARQAFEERLARCMARDNGDRRP